MQFHKIAKSQMLGGQPSQLYPGFLPTNFDGTVSWLDAVDQSTINKDTLNKITEVSDKSDLKLNNALQLTPANQPIWAENQINGRPAFVLDNDDFLTIANHSSLNFDGGAGFTIFMVVNYDGYDNQGAGINLLLAKGSGSAVQDAYNIQTPSDNKVDFQSGNAELVFSDRAIVGNAHFLTATMDNAATKAQLFADGFLIAENNSATVGSDNALDLTIGGGTGNSLRYAAGKYGEIIIYNRPLLSSERVRVELYLNIKWGILDALIWRDEMGAAILDENGHFIYL